MKRSTFLESHLNSKTGNSERAITRRSRALDESQLQFNFKNEGFQCAIMKLYCDELHLKCLRWRFSVPSENGEVAVEHLAETIKSEA